MSNLKNILVSLNKVDNEPNKAAQTTVDNHTPNVKVFRKNDIERLKTKLEAEGFELAVVEFKDWYTIGVLKKDSDGNDIFLKSDMFKKSLRTKRNCIAVNNIIVKAGLSWTNLLLHVYNNMQLTVPWPIEDLEEYKKLVFDAVEANYIKPKVIVDTKLGGEI